MKHAKATQSLHHILPHLKHRYAIPFWQQPRLEDGVRGIFLQRPVETGDLLFSVPLRYCYFSTTTPEEAAASPQTQDDDLWASARRQSQWVRKPNRGRGLFPEGWLWLQRFCPDAKHGATQLTASVGRPATPKGVVSVSVTPVEAMLATCVALRFFFTEVVPLKPESRSRIGPAADALADSYVRTLPLPQYLERGIEGLYSMSVPDFEVSGGGHLALETISFNLRDTILLYASSAEYNFYEQQASEFDALLLMSLYMMRSRVVQVTVLHPKGAQFDHSVSLFAPLLDGINHAPSAHCTAAAAVSLADGCVNVRATQPLPSGCEVTLDYKDEGTQRVARRRAKGVKELTAPEDSWSTRYMMS